MTHSEIKTRIKRHIKRGTFRTINTNSYNIRATSRALKNSWCYYTELDNGSLLAYNTIENKLTIYIPRK